MLVIVSDLHLCDGTTSGTVAAGAIQVFLDRVFDLALRASWRANGAYQPIDRLDILLLGDILDLTRTNRWLQSDTRPWDAPGPELAAAVDGVVTDVLQNNVEGLEAIRSLATQPLMALPPANHAGLPALEVQRHEVDVQLHYMVGDHDWLLHLPGPEFDAIRGRVINALGLAHSDTRPFAHDPSDCPRILEVLRRHRVLARHGDLFDPLHFSEDRAASSLADAIGVELINRFCQEIARHYAADVPAMVSAGLRELDHLRPILLAPVWIDSLLNQSDASQPIRRKLRHVWDQLVDEFLQLELVRSRESASAFDLVDGLESALKFSTSTTRDWPQRIQTWLQRVRGIESDSYLQHALGEPDFRNRRARHVVYGHTHQSETTPMEASFADGFVLHQNYFNTGAWRRVYRPAQGNPARQEMMPVEQLQVTAFFRDGERSGRTFESWCGTLDAVGPERWLKRLDPAQHPAANARGAQGPHFELSVDYGVSTTDAMR